MKRPDQLTSGYHAKEPGDYHPADTVARPSEGVFRDHNSHAVCVYSKGPQLTYFLGIDGAQLATMQLKHAEFADTYYRALDFTPLDFARKWTASKDAIEMVPISGAAYRVLKAILAGQAVDTDDTTLNLNRLENSMASKKATAAAAEGGFRKPDGPVAKIHAHFDKHVDKIKAGTSSRKEHIDALVDKGYALGTIVTQAGVWARQNGVAFARPAAAAGAVKQARASAKAAKAPAKGAKAAAKGGKAATKTVGKGKVPAAVLSAQGGSPEGAAVA